MKKDTEWGVNVLERCIISGFADEISSDINIQIKLLTKLNQKYLEFRSANGKGVADYSVNEAKNIKSLLDQSGIKVSSIGSPIGKISITDDFQKHYDIYKHIVQLAKVFGTTYIRIFSFYIPMGENPAGYKKEVFQRLQELIAYAKEQNIILLHENEKGIYGDNDERCYELMQEFYGEHFRCVFDFANFIQCGVDTKQAYQLLKPYISYVHIKDALYTSKEVVPPGLGDGRLAEILGDLDHSGYQGFLSLEPHLADFTGFHQLEREINVKKSIFTQEETAKLAQSCSFLVSSGLLAGGAKGQKMSDGEAAYLLAYQELQKLLNQNKENVWK